MIHSFQTIEKIPKPQQPKFWKRWVVSMLAVYPALILLVVVTRPFTEGMPAAASLFIVALLLTGLNTGLILPFLNRCLASWLAAR
ncbi:MAG: hypothetical protein KJ947_21195 [Alphaproteobacteria bacterium]|nr:hypothetical protein [Alphaproteobacteria bacterium]MBU1552064.1 hypothetical protein [Alphaproteobacteria bacterium]MBU2337674.1 hypothetical protein [Alphaproteobacteria bacterium]MBU2391514.1 hypothetical protein [Alphaproteobacteria bacterium]